jgi:hypothetical protein
MQQCHKHDWDTVAHVIGVGGHAYVHCSEGSCYDTNVLCFMSHGGVCPPYSSTCVLFLWCNTSVHHIHDMMQASHLYLLAMLQSVAEGHEKLMALSLEAAALADADGAGNANMEYEVHRHDL